MPCIKKLYCILRIPCICLVSLKYINIAMVTILKNMTNIMTAIGELYIFRKHQNQKVWAAMILMVHNTTPLLVSCEQLS